MIVVKVHGGREAVMLVSQPAHTMTVTRVVTVGRLMAAGLMVTAATMVIMVAVILAVTMVTMVTVQMTRVTMMMVTASVGNKRYVTNYIKNGIRCGQLIVFDLLETIVVRLDVVNCFVAVVSKETSGTFTVVLSYTCTTI